MSNEKKRWYVLQTQSMFENKAKEALERDIQQADLQDFFGKILVPTESIFEMKAGQKRRSERKFFPGYVLVEMEMNDETWHLVRHTSRVLGFVGGTSDKPTPISKKEVEQILARLENDVNKPRPKTLYEVGEMIRVNDGPFEDFTGVIEEVNYEKSRVRVSVSIFGRATPVELEFSQIDKL
jgi:transcription termination/antitermination protein NusG